MALRSALRGRRFELFHSSLVICGIAIAGNSFRRLSTASGQSGVLLFSILGAVTGVWFVFWGIREGWRRDREDWKTKFEGYALAIWMVIGSAAFFVVAFVHTVVTAL